MFTSGLFLPTAKQDETQKQHTHDNPCGRHPVRPKSIDCRAADKRANNVTHSPQENEAGIDADQVTWWLGLTGLKCPRRIAGDNTLPALSGPARGFHVQPPFLTDDAPSLNL